jgi:hypothetical protein
MNKAQPFWLAFLLSILAVGTNLPATGQAIKPWESYGIRLDGSPYDVKARVRVSVTRATEQTEVAHWQGYWPANLAAPGSSHQPEAQALGDLRVYATQSGCAAPLVFGHIGGRYDTTFLYFQDLGAVGRLMDFMGEVPEPAVVVEGDRFGWRGVAVPGAWRPAREVLVSEGYLFLKHDTLATPTQRAQWYLQCLATLYEKLAPKPAKVDDWEALAARTARWLDNYPNWVKYGGYEFVPAYTNATYGGELQVLVELAEAAYRTDKQSKLSQRLLAGLPAFFQSDIGTIVSYCPYQAQPNGDSDWLVFSLAKVGAFAEGGHEPARKILLPSLKRAVQFAHHVNYRFPISYNHASALAVKEPDGVERDAVLGYAYAMMLGYDLFHDAEFLEEAKHALDHGDADEFAMPYQLQISPMGMAACGRLYKLTGEKKYLDRAQCYLAYFLQQTWFYQATWGFSAGIPTFFALNPGQGANYSAPLEQHQAAAYLDEALVLFGNDLPAPAHALSIAFIKHSIGVTRYTYPDKLPPGALAPKPFRSPWPGANLADAPIPVEDLEGGLRQSGLVGQEIYGAGAAADFARLAKKYGAGEESFVPWPINVFPRAVWMMRNGDGLFSCYHGKEAPDLRFTLPHGFHARLTQEPGVTRIFLHADDGTRPGDYDGYVEAGTNGTSRAYHISISLTPQNVLTWYNGLIYSKNAWQIFMNSPLYGVDGKGVTLEIGPGKNWTWIAIPNVRMDAAQASRITVVADALTPKTRWYLKLTCDLLKDGRITGGPDDLIPFDVKTTTGTFTCDLGALLAKNFPGQKQIDLRYIQIGMEGNPGSRVHIAKFTIE